MRKLLILSSCLITVGFVSCVKRDISENVNRPDPNTYGRVVEVGSEVAIGSADVITLSCAKYDNEFGCTNWNRLRTLTDANGKFAVNNFRNHIIQKDGYWPYVEEPDVNCWGFFTDCGNKPTPISYYSSRGQLDSMLIKLFPVTSVTVHIKSSDSLGASLECQVLFDGFRRSGTSIFLRPGIDSSFQYPVFGNATNKIFVRRYYPAADTVGSQVRYVPKGEPSSLEIAY